MLRALALVILVCWALYERDFVKDWLSSLSGGEVLGVKFAREVIDEATLELQQLAKVATSGEPLDQQLAGNAIIRASRVAPAIVGSRIVWVDDGWSEEKPGYSEFNNKIVGLLEKLRIAVVRASSTKEAMDALRLSPFDIVISNAWRAKDAENLKGALLICKVYYFDFPDENTENKFTKQADIDSFGPNRARAIALDQFNSEANAHAAAGFGLAETIASLPGSTITKPNFIVFADATARVARSLCQYTITNRGDVLLNSIVTILEQRHANRLTPPQVAKH